MAKCYKEKILKAAKEERLITHRWTQISADFSLETMKARIQRSDILKYSKKHST